MSLQYDGQARRMLQVLQRWIADNGASADEVVEKSRRICTAALTFTVDWRLNARVNRQLAPDLAPIEGAHFDDVILFEFEIKKRSLRASRDPSQFNRLLEEITAIDPQTALSWAKEVRVLGDWGRISLHRICSACNGNGQTNDHEACPACRGQGKVIEIAQIEAVAQPTLQLAVNAPFLGDELRQFLLSQSLDWVAQRFTYPGMAARGEDTGHWQAEYQAGTPIIQFDLEVKGKSYAIAAFGEKNQIFVFPLLFDDLFADDLHSLVKLQNPDGTLTLKPKMARKIWKQFRTRPALNAVIEGFFDHNQAITDDPGQAIWRNCHYLISSEAAQKLAQAIEAMMPQLAYLNTTWLWITITVFPMLYVFFIAEGVSERFGSLFSPDHTGSLAVFFDFFAEKFIAHASHLYWETVVLLLLLVPVGGVLGYLMCAFRNRRLPQKYKQQIKLKQGRSFAVALLMILGAMVAGIIYGEAVNWKLVPSFQHKIYDIGTYCNADIEAQIIDVYMNKQSAMECRSSIMLAIDSEMNEISKQITMK